MDGTSGLDAMRDIVIGQADVARLLMRHHTALYAFVFACVRSHHDTEDILQNVSATVVESIDQLRDETGFLPWSREIARRSTLAYCRKKRREQPLDPELIQHLAEAADVLEQEQPTAPFAEALTACLEGLPAESRRVMALRYDDAFVDTETLARKLGRSVQALYAHVKRVKTALRDCVERRLATELQT
jgi:RNA polymerase sigma-70 factor (ECF subfamily)